MLSDRSDPNLIDVCATVLQYIRSTQVDHPNPRPIPTTSDHPLQHLDDVVAVLSDPHCYTSDAQHEPRKRNLTTCGPKTALLQRLFDALGAEHADGWLSGYLLNTKLLPFNSGKRSCPRRLVGHLVESYNSDGDGVVTLELSDGART